MKVLGIGQIVVDKTFIVDGYPSEGTKIDPERITPSIGSPVPSALIFLAKHGVETELVTSFDDDTDGRFIVRELKKLAMKIKKISSEKTRCNIVITNKQNGSRTILKDIVIHKPIKKIALNTLGQVDLVYIDRKEPEAFNWVIKHKKENTKIIIDPSCEVSYNTIEMIRYADFPIIPIELVKNFDTKKDLEENLNSLFEITKKDIFVTCGSRGTCIFNGKDYSLIPTYKISCIDTLGAGDVYRGAFGFGVLQKWDLDKTVDFANLVSALQCTKTGNSTAIPTREEIALFRKKAEKRKFTKKHLEILFKE